MTTGQVTRGTELGDFLYNNAKLKDVINIVEIGTWLGGGSTKIIVDGVIDSGVKKNFITIESHKPFYDHACSLLEEYKDYVTLLHGSILVENDLNWFNYADLDPNVYKREWFDLDLNNIKNSQNVLDKIPNTIDMLFLDGGEFSTYPEWLKLKSRTKLLVMDDIKVLKNNKVHNELLNDSNYELIFEDMEYGNGCSAFLRI
jgi:hypothetical protein